MNNRIKELLLQAGFKVFGEKVVAADFASSGNATVCSQKFAELIVRECARISQECDDTMTNQGLASAQAFMEHFGVEE